ncbi:MAG: superoxide dismutase [Sarcina sp.]
MNELTAKKFNFQVIEGLTEKQLEAHYNLYKGYVTKVNEISKLSKTPEKFKGSNPTFSELRSEKLGETYAINGVKLHELYFENISEKKGEPSEALKKLISESFKDKDEMLAYLKQVALSSRGWTIVALECVTESLRVIGSDLHDSGAIWGATPILVIDVYEHAYFMDYGSDRAAYLDKVLENLNWDSVNERVEKEMKTWN